MTWILRLNFMKLYLYIVFVIRIGPYIRSPNASAHQGYSNGSCCSCIIIKADNKGGDERMSGGKGGHEKPDL